MRARPNVTCRPGKARARLAAALAVAVVTAGCLSPPTASQPTLPNLASPIRYPPNPARAAAIQGPISAARYSLTNNTDLEQGLKWIDQAIITAPNNFNALQVKSGILTKMGKTTEADKLMKDAMVNASENDINLYAYNLLGQGKHDQAIEAFISNTKRFPNSANAWDSLGEGYATKGDKDNAVKSFKKSLSLNPPDNVRANSEKFLKHLGAI